MFDQATLSNQFLVAMPRLDDEHFIQSVTLMCEHNPDGALGVVINRPTELTLTAMLKHLGLSADGLGDAAECQVYWGGPVQPQRGFVVHGPPGSWESTLKVNDELYITTSRDILSAIGQGRGPKSFLVALGYAGWEAGQLETEILHNAWLNTPVDRAILFDTPVPERWEAATRLLGVDITLLAGEAGHA